VEGHDLLESVASSLTELFAGDIMTTRIAAFEQHYPWVDTEGLRYFRTRTVQAPTDARFGLSWVKQAARSREDQERCTAALERKCQILWSLLDAVEIACGRPRLRADAQLRCDDPDAAALVVLPERAVKIGGSGAEMLALADGTRSSLEIAAAIASRHPEAPEARADAHEFLEKMVGLGVLAIGGD
jgi:hypothetical protein